jgi:hypothetical protein
VWVLSGHYETLMAVFPSLHQSWQCLLSTTAFGQGVFFITFLEGQEEGKKMTSSENSFLSCRIWKDIAIKQLNQE